MSLTGLASLLGSAIPPIKVVDVGAMMIGTPPYEPVLGLPESSLVAFEPGEEAREKLVAGAAPGHAILPHVVGRGGPAVFRVCTWNGTNSLYEPNEPLLRRFSKMAAAHVVAERVQVDTVALDDVPEASGARYLKVDAQGAELDVLQGAKKLLESILVAHLEVQFVPMYEGVPLFSDIDVMMRSRGFTLYGFDKLGRGTFAPLNRKPEAPGGQWMWADAIYFRDFMRFAELAPKELLAIALIAERCYAARDLALLALQHHDKKTGSTELYAGFCKQLLGEVREPAPLDGDSAPPRGEAPAEDAAARSAAEPPTPKGPAGAVVDVSGLPEGLLEERGEKRLHIGGRVRKAGWTNLNALAGDAVDVVGDVRDLSAFQDATFDMVYASHVMEHLSYIRVLSRVLSEIARVTKPGGRFFVSVPDLKTLATLFTHSKGDEGDRYRLMRMMFGGQVDEYDFHFVGLWDSYLASLLLQAGFSQVYRVPSFGLFDDTSNLVYRDVLISLNMVAVR